MYHYTKSVVKNSPLTLLLDGIMPDIHNVTTASIVLTSVPMSGDDTVTVSVYDFAVVSIIL